MVARKLSELLIFNGVDVNAFDPQVREKSIEIYEVADLPPQTRRQDECRIESRREMKHILITTISAVLLAYI